VGDWMGYDCWRSSGFPRRGLSQGYRSP
jgi:hypothetical protein